MILCPSSTVWYAMRSKKLLNKIKLFTDHLNDKNKKIELEKIKTELLLYEILPKSVAQELRLNKKVEPESFDCVTIYFSDIQGFTSLSAKCKPLEVKNKFINIVVVH